MEHKRLATVNGAVFGVFGHRDAAVLVRAGLQSMNHRGRYTEIVEWASGRLRHAEPRATEIVPSDDGESGHVAIGRMASREGGLPTVHTRAGSLSLMTTGQLVNAPSLERELLEAGAVLRDGTDGEILLHLLARSGQGTLINRLVDALQLARGGYACLLAAENRLVAVRDPAGIRPLFIGQLEGAVLLATESRAITTVGGGELREVLPGEMVILDEDGMTSLFPLPRANVRPCGREIVSLARADSEAFGLNCFEARRDIGRRLALESPAMVDLVSPLGRRAGPAALGMSERLGVPLYPDLFDHRSPLGDEVPLRLRSGEARIPVAAPVVRDKRVLLLHHAIGPDVPWGAAVQALKRAGAAEVHARIASPPTLFPCIYGIPLVPAAAHAPVGSTAERMREELGADTFGWLEPGHLQLAVAGNPIEFCEGCYSGRYPLVHEDLEQPPQLPLFGE